MIIIIQLEIFTMGLMFGFCNNFVRSRDRTIFCLRFRIDYVFISIKSIKKRLSNIEYFKITALLWNAIGRLSDQKAKKEDGNHATTSHKCG